MEAVVKNMAKIPNWARDAIFYQIFPDRFARSARPGKDNFQPWGSTPTVNGFQGGDIYGIIEKIPYLKDLGVTAIYLNPVFAAGSNHRYNTFDYYKVDPLLGGNEALKELIDALHKSGMKIIMDGVFNHVGRGFYQFNHVLECGESSPYRDWFKIESFPLNAYSNDKKANYWCWWGIKDLPKLNTDNKEVRSFILDVAAHWIRFGADGWRLDVPNEINDDAFWQEFRRVVKKENSEAYIVGEIWKDEEKYTAERWLKGDQFDAIMNYGFKIACEGFFIGDRLDKSLVNDGEGQAHVSKLSAKQFAGRIELILSRYDKDIVYSQYNLLDSHDTARLLTMCGGDLRVMKLAVLMMMMYPGAPAIYYGDEIGIDGGKDPDCRKAFNWDENFWNKDLRAYYKKLIEIRKKYSCIRHGSYRTVYADDAKNMYVFKREYNGEKVLVLINNSEQDNSIDFSLEGFSGTCLVSGEKVKSIVKAKMAYVLGS